MVDIDWPASFERTPPDERSKNRNYEVTLSKALDEIEAEMDRLGVDEHRISTDAKQRQRDNRPYANANPDDPGFALYWTMDGDQYAVACDRYSRLRDNTRTVGLYINEKRKMEGRPVETGESEFANARLPSGEEDVVVVGDRRSAHEVLGVAPDAPANEVREAYRERVKETHPDQPSGDRQAFDRVERAREVLLGE